jgi:hypothetical protein
MRYKHYTCWFACMLFSGFICAQDTIAIHQEKTKEPWVFDASANLYFTPDKNFINPVVTADKGRLHLEARYNYEDFNTGSVWGGYNFSVGKKWVLEATPMAGIVFGTVNGIAPGLELSLSHKWLEFYTEGEWFASFNSKDENFAYFWSDLYFYPKEWLWLGISGQRLRMFESPLEVQKGLLAGGSFKNFYLTSYFYNPFSEGNFYMVVSAGVEF